MDERADKLQDEKWNREHQGTEVSSGPAIIPALSDDRAAIAAHTVDAIRALKEKFDAELLDLRSDLAGLDARVAGLEATVGILAGQLTKTLEIVHDLEIEHTLTPKIAPEVKQLREQVAAAFRHAGLEFENIEPSSRRR